MTAVIFALLLQVPSTSCSESPWQPTVCIDPAPEDPASLHDWKASVGLNVWSGFGNPFHDMLGPQITVGHHLHRLFGPGWWARLDFYQTKSDFENPGDQVLGTENTPVADAVIDMTSVTLAIEWHLWQPVEWLEVYAGLGIGFVTCGDGDARSLPTVDIEVTGNSGPALHLLLGASARITGPLYFTFEFRLAEIFASFDVRDRNTGETGSLDSWEAGGFTFAIEVRF